VGRKAFANAEKTAAICGVPTMLVSNLEVIWRTLASGHVQKETKYL
jgi:putative intracellular protease/amidase